MSYAYTYERGRVEYEGWSLSHAIPEAFARLLNRLDPEGFRAPDAIAAELDALLGPPRMKESPVLQVLASGAWGSEAGIIASERHWVCAEAASKLGLEKRGARYVLRAYSDQAAAPWNAMRFNLQLHGVECTLTGTFGYPRQTTHTALAEFAESMGDQCWIYAREVL